MQNDQTTLHLLVLSSKDRLFYVSASSCLMGNLIMLIINALRVPFPSPNRHRTFQTTPRFFVSYS